LYIQPGPLPEEKQICNIMMEEIASASFSLMAFSFTSERRSGAGVLDSASIMGGSSDSMFFI